jgi:hypothetical protein
MSIISKLTERGYDVTSYLKTAEKVNQFTNRTDLNRAFYEQNIHDIFGVDIQTKSVKEAEVMFRYMVSESVRFCERSRTLSVDVLRDVATEKTKQFFARFPDAMYGIDRNITSNSAENPTTDSGSKRDAAKELIVTMLTNNPAIKTADAISALMVQLDMSKAGARTYFYSLKKTIFSGGDSSDGE